VIPSAPHSPHRVRTLARACADIISAAFSTAYIYSPHSPHIYIGRERVASRPPDPVLTLSLLKRCADCADCADKPITRVRSEACGSAHFGACVADRRGVRTSSDVPSRANAPSAARGRWSGPRASRRTRGRRARTARPRAKCTRDAYRTNCTFWVLGMPPTAWSWNRP
jgi:hypothetical protein